MPIAERAVSPDMIVLYISKKVSMEIRLIGFHCVYYV